jgi:hypothetical protein
MPIRYFHDYAFRRRCHAAPIFRFHYAIATCFEMLIISGFLSFADSRLHHTLAELSILLAADACHFCR